MRSITSLRKLHAIRRRALRALELHELASHVCSNPLTAEQQARRYRLSVATVRRLRRVWRSYDPVKHQPWEVWL